MFYSQDILQKRGGRFGVVWIAATKAVNLNKREYCSVNVRKTCQDISKYLIHKSPARLSLYLSSQLMYGVIRVYGKQQQYLLEDLAHLKTKCFVQYLNFSTLETRAEIDLRPDFARTHHAVTLPDNIPAFLGHEFGRFDSSLDVALIPEIDFIKVADSHIVYDEETETLKQSKKKRTKKTKPDLSLSTDLDNTRYQASRTDITLPEEPLPADLVIPQDIELPDFDRQGLDDFVNGTKDNDALFMEKELSPETHVTEIVEDELSHSPTTADKVSRELNVLDNQDSTDLDHDMLGPAEQTCTLMEAPSAPPPLGEKSKRPPPLPVTPISPTVGEKRRTTRRKRLDLTMELPSADEAPVPKRTRKGRKTGTYLIIDQDTEITRETLKGQFTRASSLLRVSAASDDVPPAPHLSDNLYTAKALLSQPGHHALRSNPRMRALHTRCQRTISSETPSSKELWTVPETTSDEQEFSTPELQRQEHIPSMNLSHEVEEAEKGRDAELSRSALEMSSTTMPAALTSTSGLNLNVSDDDSIISGRRSTRSRKSRLETTQHETILENMPLETTTHQLPEMPHPDFTGPELHISDEHQSPEQRVIPPVDEEYTQQQLFERINSIYAALNETSEETVWVDFKQHLCPPKTCPRREASRTFRDILVLRKQRVIFAFQDHPNQFSDIRVAPWG